MVAMYQMIVVGMAILSSPRENYITHLAVKEGWDKAQIRTLVAVSAVLTTYINAISSRPMLYRLIRLNPKDLVVRWCQPSPP